jgi:hypothetical protein
MFRFHYDRVQVITPTNYIRSGFMAIAIEYVPKYLPFIMYHYHPLSTIIYHYLPLSTVIYRYLPYMNLRIFWGRTFIKVLVCVV